LIKKSWAAPSKEEEKIIALEARITKPFKKGEVRDPKQGNKGKGKDQRAPNQVNQPTSSPTVLLGRPRHLLMHRRKILKQLKVGSTGGVPTTKCSVFTNRQNAMA
jgi:hypothetical protein